MAEPLKHFFDAALIRSIADSLQAVAPAFRTDAFVTDGLDGLDDLELVARSAHVADVMRRHLPTAFPAAADVIVRSLGPELDSTKTDRLQRARLRRVHPAQRRRGEDRLRARCQPA